MDAQKNAAQNSTQNTSESNSNTPSLDPLRRIFIPTERRKSNGDWALQTLDKQEYVRDRQTGAIRRVTPKINGDVARRLRAEARRRKKVTND